MNDQGLRNRLRLWRVGVGLTLDEVADLTGISKAYLSRLERGQRQAPPLTRVKIARRLGVPVSTLFVVDPIREESA